MARYPSLQGANLSILSFFTAMARSFDVITDPIMAWVSDQTSWSAGRRRPYILLGAPFYALFLALFFSPPASMTGTLATTPSRAMRSSSLPTIL